MITRKKWFEWQQWNQTQIMIRKIAEENENKTTYTQSKSSIARS